MPPLLRCVDHVIIGVPDLDAAADDYERLLGFAVSAGGTHPGNGTYNRLIVLDPEYIELIARLPGAELAARSPISAMFGRAPGGIGFALGSDDIDADVAAMRARGGAVQGPFDGYLAGPDGSGRGWHMAYLADEPGVGTPASRSGGAAWRLPFVIQHDSSGAERLRRIAAPDGPGPHPIGARALRHVTVAVHDLAAARDRYVRAFDLRAEPETMDEALGARTVRLPLEQGAIVLAAPLAPPATAPDVDAGPVARDLQARGEGLFSVTVAIDDLPAAVELLRDRGVGVQIWESEGTVTRAWPEPVSAHGARLELVSRDSIAR